MLTMNCLRSRIAFVAVFSAFFLYAESRPIECRRCRGKGIIFFQHNVGTFGLSNKKSQCPICHQWILAGSSHSDPCPDCQGRGTINTPDNNNRSRQRNQSGGGNSSNNNVPIQNGFTQEQQLALDLLEAQLQGYDGFLDQNHCYGKVYKYNPKNHRGQNVLTQCIQDKKECRIASFTDNGGVIIWGNNNYYANNVSSDIINKLSDIYNKQEYVKDFTISNGGKYWCVSYGKDQWFAWHAVGSQTLYDCLNHFIKKGVGIRSVGLDDYGRCIVVGDDGEVKYSIEYEKAVKDAINKFGQIYGVSINSNGCCLFCCQNGVYFNGLASSAADALTRLNYIPRVCKHSYTGHYFFSDGKGRCDYWF